jgi:protein-tyrosine phosphatase
MIDLHSHILPEMDDGSSSVEMSRRMLETMAQQGVQTVVATPHFYASRDLPEAFLERRQRSVDLLGAEKPEQPQLLLGAEVAYFDGMGRSAEVLQQLQLGTSGLLLVEMPFGEWNKRMVQEVCDLPLQTGLTPVLAHVDRYRRSDQLPRNLDTLLECGVLLQCNADAFLQFGSRGWALKMIRGEMIHFLGSDSHNLTTRKPNLGDAAKVIEKKLGRELLEDLMSFSRELLLGE